MPAMPSPASLPPGLNAIAARLPADSKAMDSAATDPDGANLFAAHFQRLLGRQLSIEAAADQAPDAAAQVNAPTDELAALLPFIEALGLTQTTAPQSAIETQTEGTQASSSDAAIDAASAALAAPAAIVVSASPAITAARPSEQGAAHGLAFNPPPAVVANEQAQTLPGAGKDASSGESGELSAGREFSSQLVAAVAASKESPHAPGTTAAAVQNIIAQAAPGRASSPEHSNVIAQPVGTAGWTEELGNHVSWLAHRSESKAELVLTPPQMGRIEISLSVKGEQATASFASGNPVVREALEAALPRLREVLAEAGIQLGQAQVNAENARQWAQQEKHGDNSASDRPRATLQNGATSSVSSGSLSTFSDLKGGRGLVDVFA